MAHAPSEITRTYWGSPAFRAALRELVEADPVQLKEITRLINMPGGVWPLAVRDEPDDETLASMFRTAGFLLDVGTRGLYADHLYEEITELVQADGGAVRSPDALRECLELDPRADEARLREATQHRAGPAVVDVDLTLDFRLDATMGPQVLRPVVMLTLVLDRSLGGDHALTVQLPTHALKELTDALAQVTSTAAEVDARLVEADLANPSW